jgi:hypothetical protein
MKVLDRLKKLVGAAQSDGEVTAEAADVAQKVAHEDLVAELIDGGIDPAQLRAGEITIALMLIDSSGSMHSVAAEVVEGSQVMKETFEQSGNGAAIVFGQIGFSGSPYVIRPFEVATQLTQLTANSYTPSGMTDLYGTLASSISGTLAYTQRLAELELLCRVMVFIVTDGGDSEENAEPDDIKTMVTDLEHTGRWQFAMINLEDSCGFLDQVASDLGIETVIKAEYTTIKETFGLVSGEVVTASRTAITDITDDTLIE